MSAVFSDDRIYRYLLGRELQGDPVLFPMSADDDDHEMLTRGTCLFIMVNPSDADALKDDPTIRRDKGFAKSWGYGKLLVANLFAFCSPDPKALAKALEPGIAPVGPENVAYLVSAIEAADLVVCAWGNNGALISRSRTVSTWARELKPLYHLGLNDSGEPKHPLYLPASLKPELWEAK